MRAQPSRGLTGLSERCLGLQPCEVQMIKDLFCTFCFRRQQQWVRLWVRRWREHLLQQLWLRGFWCHRRDQEEESSSWPPARGAVVQWPGAGQSLSAPLSFKMCYYKTKCYVHIQLSLLSCDAIQVWDPKPFLSNFKAHGNNSATNDITTTQQPWDHNTL